MVMAMGSCLLCRRPFMFNPQAVPSLHGDPICEPCITVTNARRLEAGLEPFPIRPDAYQPLPADRW